MSVFINHNGKLSEAKEPVISAANRSYRYGDGVFETMKILRGKIILENLHFERLMTSLQTLKIKMPKLITAEHLQNEILELSKKNNCGEKARVRLSVARGNGGLYDSDDNFQYIIECWPLSETSDKLNENGLVIDIYPDARKSIDMFSNLKSANYLPYVMAALYARDNKFNDCLILNIHERICDATIANVFWIMDGVVFTPPLTEGCVAGVMRRFLLENMQDAGYAMREQEFIIDNLEHADEVFLTNTIQGVRWVKKFRDKTYTNTTTQKIYNYLLQTIYR
ncbi:MAG: aminotransferase class IV [Chitinophagaceae bacterium]|nr:MAG: aminotransferase class IV [Chitinophagaceae bacterium]